MTTRLPRNVCNCFGSVILFKKRSESDLCARDHVLRTLARASPTSFVYVEKPFFPSASILLFRVKCRRKRPAARDFNERRRHDSRPSQRAAGRRFLRKSHSVRTSAFVFLRKKMSIPLSYPQTDRRRISNRIPQ